MNADEIRDRALRYMRRGIEYAKGDGITGPCPLSGQMIGPGIDSVNPLTGAVHKGTDPKQAKEARTYFSMADIMFCRYMGWITEEEADRLTDEVNSTSE